MSVAAPFIVNPRTDQTGQMYAATMTRTLQIMIGAILVGALIAGLRELDPGLEIAGIGGEAMTAQGLSSLFPMSELSLMGIAEILPRYRHLKRRIRETAELVAQTAPDALLTIDSPDFCLRVARQARAMGFTGPVIHYVAPSVWAWRPGRAARSSPVPR